MNAIEFKHVNKDYKDFSLKDISFSFPKGMIVGLIGENGAGKTTLIKSLLGLINIDSGDIKILGKEPKNVGDDIGVVFDNSYFNSAFTPIILDKVLKGSFDSWDNGLFNKLLEKFELPKDKKISAFSKGMKVKLQIAIALAHKPSLLVLDEVTAGLDPIFRDTILDILLDYIQDENHSVLISSHDLADLEKIADLIVFIHNGSLLLIEDINNLKDNYRIFRGSKSDLKKQNGEIISVLDNDYSVSALIKTKEINSNLERPRLEVIFKILIKGEKL